MTLTSLFFFFQHVHLTLQDATLILYLFSLDFTITNVKKLLPNVANTTLIRFYHSLRQKLFDQMENITFDDETDGSSEIIEIDESLFGRKRKNNRGRSTKRQWVFGMIQRKTKKSYFIPVATRSKETLIPLIKAKVSKTCTIYHDDWAAYRSLSTEGYTSEVINHTKEFVTAEGINTNTIEGWAYICIQFY